MHVFGNVERWASVSDDRATLVTVLLCATIGVLSLAVVGTTALVMLPHNTLAF